MNAQTTVEKSTPRPEHVMLNMMRCRRPTTGRSSLKVARTRSAEVIKWVRRQHMDSWQKYWQ